MVKALTFDDVLLVPMYNPFKSRAEVDISITDKTGKLHLGLPVMSSNMDTITESSMADFMGSKGGIGVLHRFMSIDKNVEEFKKCKYKTFVSIGCGDEGLVRAEALRDVGAEYFCFDIAYAYSKYAGSTLKKLREILPNACIMAGNVATFAGAEYLVDHKVDIVKVGVGGGSVCSTRIKTGFGYPTLASIKACAPIHRSIVADGGIRNSGDIVKALTFGADFVMIGGMLAGTRPTPGQADYRIEYDTKTLITKQVYYKTYRGMASKEAFEEHTGETLSDWKTAEGVSVKVPYREDEDQIIHDIVGGLRSGLTYGGAANIRELQEDFDYVEVTQAGYIESTTHKKKD